SAEVAEPNFLPRVAVDEASLLVHVTGSPGREGADHRPELAPPVRQLVLGSRRMVGVEAAAHPAVLLHEREPLGRGAGGQAGRAGGRGTDERLQGDRAPRGASSDRPPLRGSWPPGSAARRSSACLQGSEGLTKKQVTIILQVMASTALVANPVASLPPMAAR